MESKWGKGACCGAVCGVAEARCEVLSGLAGTRDGAAGLAVSGEMKGRAPQSLFWSAACRGVVAVMDAVDVEGMAWPSIFYLQG